MSDERIRVEALTRVEGEGGLFVRLRGQEVTELRLEIYEPPRLFETILRGRPLEDAPDITARICGICPVAYQMSSVHALERALGVRVTPEIRRLRRLLYCGEWIESHTLHMHLLHAPDFLGFDSGLELGEKYPDELRRGLRLRALGNRLIELLGGRAVHPVNVCVGGFYAAPPRDDWQALVPEFEWGLRAAIETTKWMASFDFPDFQSDAPWVALRHADEYPMNEGWIATERGESIAIEAFSTTFRETQVPHSTALHCVRAASGSPYLCGPLPRVGLNLDHLSESARRLIDELPMAWPSHNPYHSIVARGLEVVHAFEEGLEVLQAGVPAGPLRVAYTPREGFGAAATEAPRGLLYHDYEVDGSGRIRRAKIVPPTSQNQAQIEADLRRRLPQLLAEPDQIPRRCENLVRCYDPCISCATHFLRVHLDVDS